jgi:hypothetical protein
MGRIRTTKPEFHAHEELSALPAETHLFASALLNYADDYGYFNANPILVKAGTNPLREDRTTVAVQMEQLEKIGYIEVRRDGIKHYGRVRNFNEHQRVSHPCPSKIKDKFEALAKPSGIIPEPLRPEGKGREQGIEGKGPDVISPEMVTRAVLTELRLSGRDLAVVLDEVCRASMKDWPTPGDLRDVMIAAYREFDAAAPNLTQYKPNTAKFFGEGYWRDKTKWPWKEGKQPKGRVYVNA